MRGGRRLLAGAAVLAALAAAAAACRGEPAVAWLSVSGVRPAVLEPDGTLFVQGSGFPAGERCSVQLRGRTSRPGLSSVRVQLTVPGRAVAGDEVAVRLDQRAFEALGQHGSFQGELRVGFPVRGGGVVTGSNAVAFDLSDPLGRGVVHAQRVREQAVRLLRFVGIEPAQDAELERGMTVASVRRESAAGALGVQAGDVITRSGGVSVHALGDLAPPPYARSIAWSVRSSDGSVNTHVLGLAGLDTPDPDAGLDRLSLLLGWLLACALLVSPLPSPPRWLAGAYRQLKRAPRGALGLWGGAPRASRTGRTRAWLHGLLPLGLSALGVLVVRFEPAGFLAVRSISLYLGLCAASVMLSLTGGGSRRARLRAALTTVGRMCVMGVLVACACAQSGTRALDGMVHTQGGLPWEWAVATRPALLLAFPLYVLFASKLGSETLAVEGHGPVASLAVGERVLTNVVLSALGAAMFAGGWQSPVQWLPPEIDARVIGAAGFVLKAWGFAWLLHAARRLELGRGLASWMVVLGCALVVGLTALEVWLEPAGFERALGRAVFANALLLALLAVLEGARDANRGLTPASQRP